MLRRSTKIQLVIFVIITLARRHLRQRRVRRADQRDLRPKWLHRSADFPDSGGIFTNAEVTYRGVTVGKVGQLHLIANGVRVDLKNKNCKQPEDPGQRDRRRSATAR